MRNYCSKRKGTKRDRYRWSSSRRATRWHGPSRRIKGRPQVCFALPFSFTVKRTGPRALLEEPASLLVCMRQVSEDEREDEGLGRTNATGASHMASTSIGIA